MYYGEPFYLQLDSSIEGVAVCLREKKGYWFFQPLGCRMAVEVHAERQWLARGHDDITPEPMTVSDERLTETFYVLTGSASLIASITDGADASLPIQERRLDTFPTLIQRSGSAWSLTHAFVYFMPPL